MPFSVHTRPKRPMGSTSRLESSRRVLSSAWLARNRWPFLTSRPMTKPVLGVPSRPYSTVYVYCLLVSGFDWATHWGDLELTSITPSSAFPSSKCSTTGGTYTSVTVADRGFRVGYGRPSERGERERHSTCWYERTPPFAKMRPFLDDLFAPMVGLCFPRSSRVISVIAYTISISIW